MFPIENKHIIFNQSIKVLSVENGSKPIWNEMSWIFTYPNNMELPDFYSLECSKTYARYYFEI